MEEFAKNFDAAMHHLRTVIAAKDDREAVRRLMASKQHIEKCVDNLNDARK